MQTAPELVLAANPTSQPSMSPNPTQADVAPEVTNHRDSTEQPDSTYQSDGPVARQQVEDEETEVGHNQSHYTGQGGSIPESDRTSTPASTQAAHRLA
jgi:hypothetical protein